jgi:hypothetical protein
MRSFACFLALSHFHFLPLPNLAKLDPSIFFSAATGVQPFIGTHGQQVLLPPAQPIAGAQLGQAQPFPPQKDKLESALDFLEQVKSVFEHRLEVYNQFLDIMKEFKAHS